MARPACQYRLPSAPAELALRSLAVHGCVCHEHPRTGKGPAAPPAGQGVGRTDTERELAAVCGGWKRKSLGAHFRVSWPEDGSRGELPGPAHVPHVKEGQAGGSCVQSHNQQVSGGMSAEECPALTCDAHQSCKFPRLGPVRPCHAGSSILF